MTRHCIRPALRQQRRRQHGVATLVVVMVLFFVVAMVAAYTSRNLIFEQKTSANQYRSTQAFEAAEAGLEWGLAMLNGATVADDCAAAAPAAGRSFQQRYLSITSVPGDPDNGRIANAAGRPIAAADNWPACVFDGDGWGQPANCKCPGATALAPAAPAATGGHPAFRVWLADPWTTPALAQPGALYLRANGCTRMPDAGERCLDFDPRADIGDGVAAVQITVLLRSGLPMLPAAPVTARLAVQPDAAAVPLLRVINTDAATNGITVNAGGNVASGRVSAESMPGTPSLASIVANDTRLNALTTNVATGPDALTSGERMFVSQFGMTRQSYREQPGLRRCPAAGALTCSASDVNALLARNPNRVIWVEGDLTVDTPIGSVPEPVLLIVNGSTLTLTTGASITGAVYITGGNTAAPVSLVLPETATSITGALISETSLSTTYPAGGASAAGALTVTYHPGVLNLLRTSYGSWVRMAGSWKDFGPN